MKREMIAALSGAGMFAMLATAVVPQGSNQHVTEHETPEAAANLALDPYCCWVEYIATEDSPYVVEPTSESAQASRPVYEIRARAPYENREPPDTTEAPERLGQQREQAQDTLELPDVDPPVQGQEPRNEPPGMTLIGASDGSVKSSNGHAFGIASFNDWVEGPGTIAVADDPSNPTGSGKSLRFTWAAGKPAVNSGVGIAEAALSGGPYRELYIRFQIFMESGGWEHGHKFFYLRKSGVSNSIITDRPSGNAIEKTRLVGAGIRLDSDRAAYGSTGAMPRPLALDRWVTMEYHIGASTSPDTPDGFARMWVDGELVAMRDSTQTAMSSFDGFEWYARANSVPVVSHYRIGELYISGRK